VRGALGLLLRSGPEAAVRDGLSPAGAFGRQDVIWGI